MNIHILPTNKPSELYINTETNILCRSYDLLRPKSQNMYITNDEEIKEGDWCIYLGLSMTYFKVIEINDFKLYYGSRECFNRTNCKKIILTTDSKLIAKSYKDGLQDIDDDFLEWFLKNPSCEKVEFNKIAIKCSCATQSKYKDNANAINENTTCHLRNNCEIQYKVVIPKENLVYTTKSGIDVPDEMVRAVMIPKESYE